MPRRKPLTFKNNGIEALGVIRGTIHLQTPTSDPCVYCGGEGTTKEHVLPRSLGGPNSWTNIVRACEACNRERASVPLLLFLISRLNHKKGEPLKGDCL